MPADAYSRMDSNASGTESASGGANENLISSSPSTSMTSRDRTDSEGSDRQPRFVLPGTEGSPPKVLTMDEVHKAITNVENMTLAHEIAVNPEFRLQPYEPPENSLEKNIKDMIHKAFWCSLREQLTKDPPCYDDAIQLLADIKEGFTHIISKNNQKALDRICDVLDSTIIRQQAEQGVLDFKSYAHFIIQIMAKSCAPVRDEEVAKLWAIDDVVDTFRGILETMSLMKLDMANCLLEAARRDVIANSVVYEKQKFQEYLNIYTLGFPITENWLHRHKPADTSAPHWEDSTIINAYLDFLDWNEAEEFPETILMDKDRLLGLQSRALRLCVCASTMAIANSVPILGRNSEIKSTLTRQIQIILQSVKCNKDLEKTMENVWVQVKSVIKSQLLESKQSEMDETTENSIKQQILQIANKDSPVRSLMWKRLMAYVRLVKTNKTIPPPPPGFLDFTEELEMFMIFKRITIYNYSVFGEHYHEILNKDKPLPLDDSSAATTTTKTSNKTTTTIATSTTNTTNATTITAPIAIPAASLSAASSRKNDDEKQ